MNKITLNFISEKIYKVGRKSYTLEPVIKLEGLYFKKVIGSNNKLPNKLIELKIILCDLYDLKLLDLSYNNLSKFNKSLRAPKLTEINLSKNKITHIPIFKNEYLKNLDLSRNQLISFPDILDKLPLLKILNVSQNELTSFPKTYNLEELNLLMDQKII